ncbi:MAG: hypothetical protein KDI54_18025 [Gammaproteobacteria bacterium]|nr:hypothetical protein [Gammaproteobacteria bacterium]
MAEPIAGVRVSQRLPLFSNHGGSVQQPTGHLPQQYAVECHDSFAGYRSSDKVFERIFSLRVWREVTLIKLAQRHPLTPPEQSVRHSPPERDVRSAPTG